ncbi:Agenet domain plant type domain-containing protein [Dioscorea alata]|uniref:Agenet domain plant type domain-containing protein n=1 Tax=Dioscorea alata TaxID=55571 RepID=A0ACB7TZ92_DIOAL|nr:Agenet domain plant type domain-containing protein [Dioscorea alata]
MGYDRSGGFKVGEEVEVSCDDEGFHGAWYEATVARRLNGSRRLSIVYTSLLSDTDPSQRLQESVDLAHVRPRPPRLRKRAFEVFQLVEGYHRDGWWPGVVAGVRGKQCLVCFPSTKEELEFPASKIRPRLNWLKGRWIAAGDEGCLGDKFSVGAQVEVTRDKEIYGAAWFPGRVVKVVGDTYFLVEYENLGPNDNTCTKGNELLREIVDDQYMRPSPPDTAYVKDFFIQDEVEVLVCGRWLAGVISKIILFGSKYIVKLKYQDLEDGFDISELRLHYDWTDEQWICTSMRNRGKSVVAGKTRSIDGRQKSGVEGSSPQVQINGIIANEPSEPLSHNMIPACKGKRTSRQKQVSKSCSRKRTAMEPQLDIVMPKRNKSDGSGSEDLCEDPQPYKNSNEEETTLVESMEEQCHSESYLQGKSTTTTQLALESPPDTSEDLLYEQFKRNLYEVTGTPDLSTADMENHENSNGANINTTKRIKKIAVRNSSRLRKTLDLDVIDEPTEEERIETTGTPLKKFATLKNASVACEQEHIKKSAEVVVESENGRKEVALPSPNPPSYLNNEMESVMRNEFPTPVGDIIDPSETYVSAERINRRLQILDTWTLPKKDYHAAPCLNHSTRSKPRESTGNAPQCDFNEAVIEVPLDEDSSNIHQEPMTNWLALKQTSVDKNGASGKFLANNSAGKAHTLPFEKNSAMWKPFESLEIFHMMPQQPHFRALEQYCEEFREGMAIGFMVTFANLINDLSKLRITDSTEVFLAKLKALPRLEANGFDVQCLRSRIEKLLKIKCELNQHEMKRASLDEQISERNNENAHYDTMIAGLDKNIADVEKTLAHLHEKRSATIMLKKTNDYEVVNMQKDIQSTEEAFLSSERDFHAAVVAPWW